MNNEPLGLPRLAWAGIALMLAAEVALYFKLTWVATWFTPIMWTGYIIAGNGWLKKQSGRSWLHDSRREFAFMALISVLVWLLFEAYNLHLVNWLYRGLPPEPFWRDLGYFWSFATIMPGVFITYKLVRNLWPAPPGNQSVKAGILSVGPKWLWFLGGLMMVLVPLLLPQRTASYLFALVWLGFIFLLDPINEGLGLPNLRQQWRQGHWRKTGQWLAAGLICGLLWETWNYQTMINGGAHWIYTVPAPLRLSGLHFGQMPIEGLLGFPPFALELRAFYLWLRRMLGGDRIYGSGLIE